MLRRPNTDHDTGQRMKEFEATALEKGAVAAHRNLFVDKSTNLLGRHSIGRKRCGVLQSKPALVGPVFAPDLSVRAPGS